MDKRFWGIILAIILIFVGIVYVNNRSDSNTTASPSHHVEGNNTKNVTLVEYGDYQCPACESYYPIVKQVLAPQRPQLCRINSGKCTTCCTITKTHGQNPAIQLVTSINMRPSLA